MCEDYDVVDKRVHACEWRVGRDSNEAGYVFAALHLDVCDGRR